MSDDSCSVDNKCMSRVLLGVYLEHAQLLVMVNVTLSDVTIETLAFPQSTALIFLIIAYWTLILNYTYSHTASERSHIDNTTSKTNTNKTLKLIERNLNKCSQEVKAKAYTTLVRYELEYSSVV